jgi:solute carrier family 12 (potassium/chloride transporters), member 9
LILQLGVILNTVPAWKKAYKVRVAVFVEYESDVKEERGRVQSLLENLRIEAEVLVFWLASGNLPAYEIIVNGVSPGKEYEEEVEECLGGQEWWDEIQKFRGNRGGASAADDLSDIASIFTTGSMWPESSFQQGPRGGRVERFLGLRKLLRKSKRRHTMSGITRLGVNLEMRTHRLSPNVVNQHASQGSASEDSGSDSDGVSTDSEAIADDDMDNGSDGRESAASEGDIDDFESENDSLPNTTRLVRRRSHGDGVQGPPPSRESTGEKEIKVPERPSRRLLPTQSSTTLSVINTSPAGQPASAPNVPLPSETPSRKPSTVSNLTTSLKASSDASDSRPASAHEPDKTHSKAEASTSTQRPSSVLSDRPSLSRHASAPKFSSKPVPITRVATEDGPGPSIMFTDTPSPPPIRRQRLPSAYRPSSTMPDHISEASEEVSSSDDTNSRRGSTYSTQALPLSFNDLPCRAQHLILNELMRSQSKETAVMFTTLPSPVEGTSQSAEASAGYLGDLEVLCKGCPPVLLVHSNSMTVTMSL